MRVAYFDCFSGASGDMILGALIDAGVPLEALRERLQGLALPDFELRAEPVDKQGFAATRVTVQTGPDQPHRHLEHILKLIREAKLSDRVREDASRVFQRLGDAEAGVHGIPVERVHFHEVGAVDAIVDIVGACAALEILDIEQVLCSPIPVGSGTVTCQHGVLPVPAPATARLLRDVPIAACDEVGELTTPTGAALLSTLAAGFGSLPDMTLQHVGYGAGWRDGAARPNLLRVLVGLGPGSAETEDLLVLEASIDDQSPEITAFALEQLLAAGALDAYCQPMYMKKGRPGVLLTVLCRMPDADDLERAVFAQTTTFGVRRQRVQRRALGRRFETVELPQGRIRIKIGARGGGALSAAPEFEDCRRVAEATGTPLREVMAAALAEWNQRQHADGSSSPSAPSGPQS